MKKYILSFLVFVLAFFVFGACDKGEAGAVPTSVLTANAEQTVVPEPSVTPETVATAGPTATPKPTATPEPTPTPEPTVDVSVHEEILKQQLTMPVISIDTLGKSVRTKDYYTSALITIWDEDGRLDTETTGISIRLRGNITLNVDKKSYRIKFPQKENPLGLGDGAAKSWNLVANYYDGSLLRNMAAYRMGELMDHMPYTANCRSVELYVNGEYRGVYLLVEAVNVAKSRVAITEKPELIEDNGYLLELSRYAEENAFTIDFFKFEVKSDVSEDIETRKQQIAYISGYTKEALYALKSGDREAIEQYIDVPSLVDNCIVNEICKNVDAGWDSYYLSKDAGGKLTFHPVWDYDLALGNNTEAKGISEPKGLGIFNISDSCANSNPWLCYALHCDWFRELLTERWNEKYGELKEVSAFVTEEARRNEASYNRNFTEWKLLGSPIYNEPEEIAVLGTHAEHAEYLAEWIDTRVDWLNGYYNSEEFAKGIFLDEKEREIDTENAIGVSALFLWGMTGSIDTDSPGFTAEAGNGWGGQAISSGLMLKEGQEYLLSFDYTAPDTASINYRFQQNYGSYRPYSSGSVQGGNERQHFKTSFIVSATDSNVALVLEFKGAGTVKVEHLSLIPAE